MMDIFVAPKTCSKLEIVKFPHAKNPLEPQSYLHDEENLVLYEVVKFTDQYRSWFLDNLLCQEGHMNFLTPINPLFIFLPQLMNFATNQFRTLLDICQTFSSTPSNENFSQLDCALSPTIDWTKVCDTKEIDDELFVRFSESKTLDWLLGKHKQTVAALTKQQSTSQTSRANLILEASDLIDQYLPSSLGVKFKTLVRSSNMTTTGTNDANVIGSTSSRPKSISHSGGTKRTAPGAVGNLATGRISTMQTKQKIVSSAKPEPKTGIRNFFKPVNKPG